MSGLSELTAAARRRPRETGAAVLGLVMAATVLTALGLRRSGPAVPVASLRTASFTETLIEPGSVSAQHLMLYASTIPGAQAKIVELIPEGSAVVSGDVLVRFDTSSFQQARARDWAALQQADADLLRAREEVRVEALTIAASIDRARQQVGFAEDGLANQISGRGPVQLAEAEASVAEAVREVSRARKAYDDLIPMLSQGFITRSELDRARQAAEHAEDQQHVAEARRDALVRYEQPAAAGRAQAELHAARTDVVRAEESAAARVRQREASLAALEAHVREIRARLAIVDEQLSHAVIRAAGPGLVVYRDLFFGSDRRKPMVGDEVWPNQPLIALPDSMQLTVETRVREIDLHKVASSQHVEVRVDAYPDLALPASVGIVGALAQEDPSHAGTKYFPVTIHLARGDTRLRTGMTARVQIKVRSLPSALVVPSEAVMTDHGDRILYVRRGARWDRCVVRLIAENDTEVAIDGPVSPGDVVALVDPFADEGRR